MIYYKNRILNHDAPVEIYRCLKRKGVIYSVRQFGKVVAHTDNIVLRGCKFIVNESGRQRVIKTKQKNVHAYIKGYVATVDSIQLSFSHLVKYNPYKFGYFYISDNTPIKKAKIVYTQNNYLYTQF